MIEVVRMTTGDRLRLEREKKGWTQLQAAEILGISNAALSNYERDVRQPDYEMLRRFARIFSTTTDYLLGYSNSRAVSTFNTQNALNESRRARFIPVLSLPIAPNIPLSQQDNVGSYPLLVDDQYEDYFYIKNSPLQATPPASENEELLLLKMQKHIEPGSFMLAWAESKPTIIARLYEEHQRVIAIGADPKDPPFIFPRKDLEIIAKVIAGIQFYK